VSWHTPGPGRGRSPKGGAPPWWREGAEPDYRATLANERTFLSWSRTALALLAAALAVLRLSGITPYDLRLALACYLIMLAVAVTIVGYVQWRLRQGRMRAGEPLGHTLSQAAFMLGLLLLAGLVIVAVAIGPQ
jgi:putative membrane protein